MDVLVEARSPAFLDVVFAKRERGLALCLQDKSVSFELGHGIVNETDALICFVRKAASFCVAGD